MKVLVSAGWLGGAGGAERALHSVLRALGPDEVDVVVREQLGGPFSRVDETTTVYSLMEWRWRAASRTTGVKGALIQRALNPVRRRILPDYDVSLQFFSGGNVNPAIRADVRLLIPSGLTVTPEKAAPYDHIALQAPDNVHLAPAGASTILLPPPLFDLAEEVEPVRQPLPERYYLTVFNPYGPVKGADDLARAADVAPHPIVWCHSQRTLKWPIPHGLDQHPNIVHIDDPSPAQMRLLYENANAYLSFSRSEGFGWSAADGLRYTGAVVSRQIGILSYPEAWQAQVFRVGQEWELDWGALPDRPQQVARDLAWVSPERFRERLLAMGR